MRVMTRKALRDLRRQRAQIVAVGVTVMLGVGLFISSAGAYDNLSGSYGQTYDRLHFADLFAVGGDPAEVASAASNAGASSTRVRTQVDQPLLINDTKVLGRVVGMPSDRHPDINDVEVTEGGYLDGSRPDDVLVETHAATTFNLHPGDTLQVFTPDGWHNVNVAGVVVSPEYLWPARSRQEVLGDPNSFAVVFAPEDSARSWAGTGPNQALVLLPDGPDDPRAGAVSDAMRTAGAHDVTTQAEQPSPAALKLDLDGFQEMAVAFPLLFLTAAAMAAYVLLARRVLAEQPVIGVLMAGGAHRHRVVGHYLLQGLLIGVSGALAGAVLGVLATGLMTRAYTGALGIPDTVVSRHPDLTAVGIALGVLIGVVGALAPAVTASRTEPAAAMRNMTVSRSPGWWGRRVSRLKVLPVSVRMALRDVSRSRRRTIATALGSVLALVLVLASVGLMTSMVSALHLQYDEVERQDATVTVQASDDQGIARTLREVDGVRTVEPSVVGPVTASFGGETYATTLQGLEPNTTMHGFVPVEGSSLELPASGVLASSALAETVNIEVGDPLTLTAADGTSRQLPVVGFLDEPLGTLVYSTNDVADTVLGKTSAHTYLLQFDAGVDRDRMRASISTIPAVVAYTDTQAFVASIDQYLGLFWAFVGLMIVLGGVLALTVIYVTMAVSVVERTNELATLLAAGVSLRRVAGTLAAENMVAAALGIPVGLVLGYIAADQFLALFSSDLFRLPLDLGAWTLVLATLGVLLAAGLSQVPAARAIRRLDVAGVVRERAL